MADNLLKPSDWMRSDSDIWYQELKGIRWRLLEMLVCCTGEGKAKNLGSLSNMLEAHFNHVVDYALVVLSWHGLSCFDLRCMSNSSSGRRIPHDFLVEFATAYGYFLRASHSQVGSFSQFAAPVEEYLASFPVELKSSSDNFSTDSDSSEWLTCNSAVERAYAATARKLESFKRLISRFEGRCWCIDEEKLRCCLAGAGALVLSVACVGCKNQFINLVKAYDRWRFPGEILRGCEDLSEKLSPHNPLVIQIYGQVLGGYLEVMKAAAASANSSSAEHRVESFFALLELAEEQVDILGDILDYPLMDLIVKLEDHNEQVEYWLKLAFAPAVREAGSSLTSFIPNVLPSKLLHKLKLIKAEMFALELHNQKSKLCGVSADGDRVATLREAFRFLSKFFKIPEPEVYMVEDRGKLALVRIEALLREAAGSLCDSHQVKKFTQDMIFKLSLAIFKLYKAEAMLMVLIDNDASLKFLARYRLETLQKSLIFLGALLSDPPNHDYVEDGNVSTFIEALVTQTTTLVCSIGGNKMERNQPVEMNMNILTSHLSKKIELNSAEIKAVHQQAGPWWLFSNFPKKDGVFFVDFLLAELRELLKNNPDTISSMNDQVEVLLEGLELLRSYLKDVQQQHNEDEDIGTRVVCLIYEAEYIINLFVVGDVPVWYHQLVLFNAIEETKLIQAQILEYYYGGKEILCNAQQTLGRMTLEASKLGSDEVIVGFDDHAKIIMDQLMSSTPQLQIVSIVGMPGLGKTTLAKKVYNDLSIQHHFMVRAWCYVSQVYRKRELLLDLLGDLVQVTDEIKRKDDEGIAKTLYQSLKGKRYLIVMDDMWSIEPWSDLKSSLPDDSKGSRILFTSRVRDVALQREPYVLPLLSDGKSWDLLQEKLFHGASCPEHLLQVGRLIAKNCKGLSLAIVVIAGLLKKIEKRKDQWEEIAEHLRSHIVDDRESQFMDILEFSYNHLPSYLKPCFLYFGVFLEDQEVPVQKLKWLWIAEGFIPRTAGRSLEGTAEGYFLELTTRSLVMEAKKRSRGGTKTCRMHDVLRDLCLKKAKEENFMQLISMKDTSNSDSLVSMFYRLCVHSPKHHLIQSKPFGPHVHSLLFFPTGDSDNRRSYDISCIFQNFKLLRVLDLEYMTIDKTFPNEIEFMLCLKFLAVRGNINSVPPSIAKLLNLEILIVKGTRGEIAIRSTLWSMPRLSHVQVHPRAAFALLGHERENSMMLDNLAILSSPVFSPGEEAQKLLRRLIRLKKLRCIFLEHWNSFRKCNVFPVMAFLDQLESLRISYHGRIVFPCEFSFPMNLKKLTLSKFRLPWEYIVAVGQLPNLEVLKLLRRAFEGQTWDMTEGEFPNLKYLKLADLNLANWNASNENFPQLERLVLQNCNKLEEVPSSFGDIPTLQMIEMHWCSQSATDSLETIYEQQLDLGNKDFKVFKTNSV